MLKFIAKFQLLCVVLAGAQEDLIGPYGSPTESRLRSSSGQLHPQMSGEAQHRYFTHQILCYRGEAQVIS